MNQSCLLINRNRSAAALEKVFTTNPQCHASHSGSLLYYQYTINMKLKAMQYHVIPFNRVQHHEISHITPGSNNVPLWTSAASSQKRPLGANQGHWSASWLTSFMLYFCYKFVKVCHFCPFLTKMLDYAPGANFYCIFTL